MPQAVEDALRKVANKYARKGKLKGKEDSLEKQKKHFIYGIMTKMQERGSIGKWRTIKHPKVA